MANPQGCNQYKICTGGGPRSPGGSTPRTVASLMSIPEGRTVRMGGSTVRAHRGYAVIHTRDRYSPNVTYTERVKTGRKTGLRAALGRWMRMER